MWCIWSWRGNSNYVGTSVGCMTIDNQLVGEERSGVWHHIGGLNMRWRPSKEWMDDIKEWCRTDVQTLSIVAQDCSEWKRVVMETLDINGRKPMEWRRRRRRRRRRRSSEFIPLYLNYALLYYTIHHYTIQCDIRRTLAYYTTQLALLDHFYGTN